MRRLFALVVTLLLIAGSSAITAAQEGVSIDVLAQAAVEELPPAPANLVFSRVTVAPGAVGAMEPSPATSLVSVQAGSLGVDVTGSVTVIRAGTAATPAAWEEPAAGEEFTLETGDAALLGAGAGGPVRNAGSEPAVALVLGIGPAEETRTETPSWRPPIVSATPSGTEDESPGVTSVLLAFGVDEALPTGPVALVIARVAVAPGAGLPPHAHAGPELVSVEAGNAVVQVVEGPPARIARGLATAGGAAAPTIEDVVPGRDAAMGAGDALLIPTGCVLGMEVVEEVEAVALVVLVEPLAAGEATTEP